MSFGSGQLQFFVLTGQIGHIACRLLVKQSQHFYTWKQLLLSAHLSHHNSVCLFVCPSVTQSKMVQALITISSPQLPAIL